MTQEHNVWHEPTEMPTRNGSFIITESKRCDTFYMGDGEILYKEEIDPDSSWGETYEQSFQDWIQGEKWTTLTELLNCVPANEKLERIKK